MQCEDPNPLGSGCGECYACRLSYAEPKCHRCYAPRTNSSPHDPTLCAHCGEVVRAAQASAKKEGE